MTEPIANNATGPGGLFSNPALGSLNVVQPRKSKSARRRAEKAALKTASSAIKDRTYIDKAYRKFHNTVNMSASELENWASDPISKRASLSREPIARNLRLLRKPKEQWTRADARGAMRTVNFVSRMRGMPKGKPINQDTPYSKRDISLMNWAYRPS